MKIHCRWRLRTSTFQWCLLSCFAGSPNQLPLSRSARTNHTRSKWTLWFELERHHRILKIHFQRLLFPFHFWMRLAFRLWDFRARVMSPKLRLTCSHLFCFIEWLFQWRARSCKCLALCRNQAGFPCPRCRLSKIRWSAFWEDADRRSAALWLIRKYGSLIFPLTKSFWPQISSSQFEVLIQLNLTTQTYQY